MQRCGGAAGEGDPTPETASAEGEPGRGGHGPGTAQGGRLTHLYLCVYIRLYVTEQIILGLKHWCYTRFETSAGTGCSSVVRAAAAKP